MNTLTRFLRTYSVHTLVTAACVFPTFLNASEADSTVAHWRFEEGPAGTAVEPPREDLVLDSSGNGNHLQTWAASTAPVYVGEDVPFDSVPQSGVPNDFSLSFANGNRDLYTQEKPINSLVFDELTIEVSFKMNEVDRFQVVVGKDGNPINGAPPISIKILRNGLLDLQIVDGSGEIRNVQSEEPLQTGVWYSAAATASGTEIALWLMRPGDSEYELQATLPVEGLFVMEARHWTIGRGMWNGGNADFFNGLIDEVRISSAVLEPFSFLGVSPDPSIGQGTLLELSQRPIPPEETAAESEA